MTIYDFSFTSTDGKTISLSEYKDNVLLIVNTATKCGLAGQFEELEMLNKKYKDNGLVIIGFPCDQFMGQEPETNDTVAQVCLVNFGVTFTLSQKIEVNGESTHPLFVYLKSELPGGFLGLFGKNIKWNFTKFLIGKTGRPYKRYSPTTTPTSMEAEIVKLLG